MKAIRLSVAAACGLAMFVASVISARAGWSPDPQSKGEQHAS
jgi:hypothetical protein